MKEEDTSDFIAFKQMFACISIVGSIIVLASLQVCINWRGRMPPLKWILCAIGIFNLLSAVNYLYYDRSVDITCRVQASMLQFFEMGSTLYACVMAFETHVLLRIVTSRLERLRFSMSSAKTITRHLIYHLSIVLYGTSTVIWMNVTEGYGENGTWCWIKRPYYRLYLYYVPTWISILAILLLDIEVVRIVFKSYQHLTSLRHSIGTNETQSQDEVLTTDSNKTTIAPKYTKINDKTFRVFLRMTLYPLCLLLLILPGSVVRIIQAGDFEIDGTVFRVLSIARNMCDPSFGTINVVMWIFSDAEVLEEWNSILRRWLFRLFMYFNWDASRFREVSKQQQLKKTSYATTNNIDMNTTTNDITDILIPPSHRDYDVSSEAAYGSWNASSAKDMLNYLQGDSSEAFGNDSSAFPEVVWTDDNTAH